MRNLFVKRLLSVSLAMGSLGFSLLHAGDWPQILGPARNGIAENEKLDSLWSDVQGPKAVWEMPVGSGLAGAAVAKGTTFIVHRKDDQEVLDAVDSQSGKPKWQATWPTNYMDTIARDDGPRCVPVIQNDRIYTLGAEGTLSCFETKDGKKVWSKNIATLYGAPLGYFGVGSTPILDSGVLIVNVGGQRNRAGIVGFNPDTGEELWKSVADTASYSSPVATTLNGQRHVIVITRLKCVSVEPKTGKVQFEFPFGERGPTVNGANPVIIKDHLLVTASYGIGATFGKMANDGIKLDWTGDEILSSQYSTPVFVDGYVYAVDGRQDAEPARLRCLDPFKKSVLWEQDGFGMATIIAVGKRLLVMKSDGKLVVIEASPKGFQKLAEAKLFDDTTRALPAFSDGRLYVRDTNTLRCFNLRFK